MDIELLKKLTKLANHNSNENEANSAARRVCKMLEEAGFVVVPDYPKTGVGTTIKVNHPSEKYDDKSYDTAIDKLWEEVFQHQKPPHK